MEKKYARTALEQKWEKEENERSAKAYDDRLSAKGQTEGAKSDMSTESDKYCRFQGCGWLATKGRYCDRHSTKEARIKIEAEQKKLMAEAKAKAKKRGVVAAILSILKRPFGGDSRVNRESFPACPKCGAKCKPESVKCWRCGERLPKVSLGVKPQIGFWKKLFGGSQLTELERAAKEGDRDKVQWWLNRCSDARVIRRAIELANKGKWHAVAQDLQSALDQMTGKVSVQHSSPGKESESPTRWSKGKPNPKSSQVVRFGKGTDSPGVRFLCPICSTPNTALAGCCKTGDFCLNHFSSWLNPLSTAVERGVLPG